MTKIKICGLKSLEDIRIVNEVMPDYVGFVFAGEKRRISDEQAARLKASLNDKIRAVGVFVNDEKAHIVSLCKDKVIDMIQLHGDETNEYIRELRKEVNVPIIKAVRLKHKEDTRIVEDSDAEYVLYDSFVTKDVYGGTGKELDLSLLPQLKRPTFLAGGMGTSNIEFVISSFHPYCIDVSSSVETDGRKDARKVKEVVEIVRKYGGHEDE